MTEARPRIAFFALRELHVDVLLPVLRAVAALNRFDVGVIAPRYVESGGGRVQEGLSPATLASLAAEGVAVWAHARQDRYACVVVADACYDRVDGWGPVVCIGHGTISKGLYFSDIPYTRRENFARVLCVPGPAYVSAFGKQLFTRVVPTGFSKMDALAHPSPTHRQDLLATLGLDPAKRTVLFAPTFNPELTGLIGLEAVWAALDGSRDQVLFKLHGATDAALIERYRALAASLPHARLVEHLSLSMLMLASDVIVSDVSSAYVEGLVTGRPLIVYNNPAMATYPRFNRQDVEYRVRDAAYQVRDAAECVQRLESLRTDDPLAGKRQTYARQLFPPLDGGNCARIAGEVAAVADGLVPQTLPAGAGAMSVYVPDTVVDAERVAANIARAVTPVEVYRGDAVPPQPFISLTGAFDLPHGWDLAWFMASHFNAPSRKHPIVGLFGPMLPDREAFGAQRRSACFTKAPAFPEPVLQTLYKFQAYDQIAPASTLLGDGSIVSAGVPRDVAARWVASLNDAAGRAEALALAARRGLHIGVLTGMYGLPAD